MAIGKSVVSSIMLLGLVFFASWAHADSHTCLSIERPWSGSIGLWVNRCDVGVDVTWNGEGGCDSQPGNKYPCSGYVAPNAKAGATLEGRIEWAECKSPGGLGDVIAMERPDGSTYCWGDPSPRERADLVRRRERVSQEIQRLRVQIENERHAQAQRQQGEKTRGKPTRRPNAEPQGRTWTGFAQGTNDGGDRYTYGVVWGASSRIEAMEAALLDCSTKSAHPCNPDEPWQAKCLSVARAEFSFTAGNVFSAVMARPGDTRMAAEQSVLNLCRGDPDFYNCRLEVTGCAGEAPRRY